MQDEGQVLAKVYELILGRKVMNAVVGISYYDEVLAIELMSLAVRARLGDMPVDEARSEIDRLVADFQRSNKDINGGME